MKAYIYLAKAEWAGLKVELAKPFLLRSRLEFALWHPDY